jgi:hypothetical protein
MSTSVRIPPRDNGTQKQARNRALDLCPYHSGATGNAL